MQLRPKTFRASTYVVCILSTVSGSILLHDDAQSSDWGCQVILCLSNPGGATQFSECVPPMEKLWSTLKKGGSFPSCSGVGFSSTRPTYDPYHCAEGLNLQNIAGDEKVCRSDERTEASNDCGQNVESPTMRPDGMPVSAQFTVENGNYVCRDFKYAPVQVRERPTYVDVNIDGQGSTRVWF